MRPTAIYKAVRNYLINECNITREYVHQLVKERVESVIDQMSIEKSVHNQIGRVLQLKFGIEPNRWVSVDGLLQDLVRQELRAAVKNATRQIVNVQVTVQETRNDKS